MKDRKVNAKNAKSILRLEEMGSRSYKTVEHEGGKTDCEKIARCCAKRDNRKNLENKIMNEIIKQAPQIVPLTDPANLYG